MAINETNYQTIALAISAYAQERWTKERTITTSGLVTGNAEITSAGEGYFGQLRWYKTLNAVYNTLTTTDATDGAFSDASTDLASYIKTQFSTGMRQVNVSQLITKQDALAFFANQYAAARAQYEHDSVMGVMAGVAGAEIAVGEGIVDFDTMPSDTIGAFVDINAEGAFGAAATGSTDARKLVDASEVGAARGERLFRSMGMFYKDYEPDYAYLVTPPEQLAEFRAANLIDEDRVTDGNLEFQTLFGGKFRLVLTRSKVTGLAGANVNAASTKVSFLVKPGSIIFSEVPNPVPVEIERNARAYQGGGTTDMWYRSGFIAHPMGYNWAGVTNRFADRTTLAVGSNWTRKADPLNLGIVPIFHS